MTSDNSLAGRTVLVVDDMADTVEVIQFLFELEGCTVFTAYDGQEALDVVGKNRIDLILTDINMPIMDGWQLIQNLWANPSTATIPVVVLSAHITPNDHRSPIAKDFRNYITKPFIPETLIKKVETLLSTNSNEGQ